MRGTLATIIDGAQKHLNSSLFHLGVVVVLMHLMISLCKQKVESSTYQTLCRHCQSTIVVSDVYIFLKAHYLL